MSYRANREEKNSDENNTVGRYRMQLKHNKSKCVELGRNAESRRIRMLAA